MAASAVSCSKLAAPCLLWKEFAFQNVEHFIPTSAHQVPLLRALLSGRVKTKCSFLLSPRPHGAFPWGKGCFLLAGECQCKHQCAVELQAERIHARCAPSPCTHTSDGVRKDGMGYCSPCGLEWRKTLIFHQESTGSSPVCRAASTTPQTT